MSLTPNLSDLDAILAKLRKVAAGDIVLPEDHNDVVDALNVIRNYLAKGVPATIEEPDYSGYKLVKEAIFEWDLTGCLDPTYGISYVYLNVLRATESKILVWIILDQTSWLITTVTAFFALPGLSVLKEIKESTYGSPGYATLTYYEHYILSKMSITGKYQILVISSDEYIDATDRVKVCRCDGEELIVVDLSELQTLLQTNGYRVQGAWDAALSPSGKYFIVAQLGFLSTYLGDPRDAAAIAIRVYEAY